MYRKPRVWLVAVILSFFMVHPASGAQLSATDTSVPVLIVQPRVEWPVGAAQWEIPLFLASTGTDNWKVRLISVEIDHKPVRLDHLKYKGIQDLELPVVNVKPEVFSDLKTLKETLQMVRENKKIDQDRARQAEKIYQELSSPDISPGIKELAIDFKDEAEALGIETGKLHDIKGILEAVDEAGVKDTLNFETTAAAVGFPQRASWFHGDLHSHSRYSDGDLYLPGLKARFSNIYDFMYLTEHSNYLTPESFNTYKKDCSDTSKVDFSFFPGVEVAAVNSNYEVTGHALAYGINSLNGLENETNSTQVVIDNIDNNNPSGPSSSSIAHPFNFKIPWQDWNVTRYYGYELMSGIADDGDFASNPITKWRAELVRCMNDTFNYGYRPSARTGMDFHRIASNTYHTWVYLPPNWKSLPYDSRKSALDSSLQGGKTSVSYYGSLAVFSINSSPIGTIIKDYPAANNLRFSVWFCPVLSGNYTVYVFEDDGKEVKRMNYVLDALEQASFEFDLPSENGQHCYWVYAHGYDGPILTENAYTSPIYVSTGSKPLDVIFTVDTTGSMWDDIYNIKASASEIVNGLDSKSADYRVAVVDYRDFPTLPYGSSGDYPYHVDLPFSKDKAAITGAIQVLSLGYGADRDESVNTALVRAVNTEGIGAWRDGAVKVVILMGDAPGHNPDPFTGYTPDDVAAAAAAVDPAEIYAIAIGDRDTYDYFNNLATMTNGKVFTAATASEVVDALMKAIGEIGEPPENQPPDCSGASPSISEIWPPNHRMTPVQIMNVIDPNGDPVTITITGITQDEPVTGGGSGEESVDGSGVGTDTAYVRSERDGNGNGRVYRILFTASDGKGGVSSGSVVVGVPHDQGVNTACVDDRQIYDSTYSK